MKYIVEKTNKFQKNRDYSLNCVIKQIARFYVTIINIVFSLLHIKYVISFNNTHSLVISICNLNEILINTWKISVK